MNSAETVPLDSIISLVTDKVTCKDPTKPYVGLEHMTSGGSALDRVGSAADSISTNNVFRPGDTLFGKLRPQLRKSARATFAGYCSTDVLVLRPKDPAEAIYLSFIFRSDAVFLEAIRTEEGTKMPRCSWRSLGTVPVFWPSSRNERSRIGRILSIMDEAIAETEALIAKCQKANLGLTHDLLTRGISSDGRLRPAHDEAPDLYKRTSFGWIPRDWRNGTIDDFCATHNHLRKPIAEDVRTGMRGTFPYYGPTGILDYIDEFQADGEFCLLGEDGDHFLKFDRQPMTQLVHGRFNVNNHAHILSGRDGATTKWLHLYFINRDLTFHLTRQGAGRFKLNKASLRAIPMCVAPPAEQLEMQRLQRGIGPLWRSEPEYPPYPPARRTRHHPSVRLRQSCGRLYEACHPPGGAIHRRLRVRRYR
jgi:hypothetical protein